MEPLVSCIIPTGNRPCFLRQAVKYFKNQTYENKELVILDDGSQPTTDLVEKGDPITYIHLGEPATMGAKLNQGIKLARGQIIQKWDDDDYYHPDFLKTNVARLRQQDPEGCVVCHDQFLVYLAATGKLKRSGSGWCAGGTLCFSRSLWQKAGFRSRNRAVDRFFLEDHRPTRRKVVRPELYILVRHSRNTWNTLDRRGVDDYMGGLPDYHRTLDQVVGSEDARFYRGLAGN